MIRQRRRSRALESRVRAAAEAWARLDRVVSRIAGPFTVGCCAARSFGAVGTASPGTRVVVELWRGRPMRALAITRHVALLALTRYPRRFAGSSGGLRHRSRGTAGVVFLAVVDRGHA
jgi:hypothetical protein